MRSEADRAQRTYQNRGFELFLQNDWRREESSVRQAQTPEDEKANARPKQTPNSAKKPAHGTGEQDEF